MAQLEQPLLEDPYEGPGFDVSITAAGAFVPGAPITLSARAVAFTAFNDAELDISAPELEFARMTGWSEAYRDLIEWAIPSRGNVRSAPSSGGSLATSATFVPEVPGIYRFAATVRGTPTNPYARVANVGRSVIWVLVEPAGGRLISRFDAADVPEGRVRSPGPFRTAEVSRRSPDVPGPAAVECQSLCEDIYVYYYDAVESAYLLLPDQDVYVEYSVGGQSQPFETLTTNWYGDLSYDCDASWTDITFTTSVGASTRHQVVILNGESDYTQTDDFDDCASIPDGDVYLEMPDTAAVVFKRLKRATTGADDAFGEAADAKLRWYGSVPTGAVYSPASDEIHVGNGFIWGDDLGGGTDDPSGYVEWVYSHEYGHAIHDQLWVNPAGGNCPQIHYVSHAYNSQCAFSEGVASWLSVVVGFDPWFDWENQTYWTNGDGYEIEGVVTGFLLDLPFSASYIGGVIDDCQVDGLAVDRVHYMIHCMEGTIYGYNDQFPLSDEPNSADEMCPTGGCAANLSTIRSAWMGNHVYHLTDVLWFGPTAVNEGEACSWEAVQQSQGTYTFRWSLDGDSVAGAALLELEDVGTQDFQLVLDWASWDKSRSDTVNVTVEEPWSVPPCY